MNMTRTLTLILVLIIGGVFAWEGFTYVTETNNLTQARQDHEIAEKKLKETKNKRTEQQEANASEATGLKLSRQTQDDGVIRELFTMAGTWKSNEEYIKKREAVKKKYGFKDDSYFMRIFMPGEKEGAWAVDKRGKKYFRYEKARSEFVDMKSTVTGAKGADRTYMTRVTLKATTDGGEASRTMMATYTIDNKGKISDMVVYTSPAAVGTSS